jgi:plastocyanin
VIVGLAALLFLTSISFLAPAPVRAADFTLYGSAGAGWGFTPGSISSPGPTLTVTQGEMVHLSLFAADGAPHSWCIDYSGNNACEAGENESAVFSSMTIPLSHMFIATGAPGTYNYVCGVHGGFVMRGLFRITAAVNPVVTISAPTGNQKWTGGTPHDIVWTMTDPQDPVTSLNAAIAYSPTSANGPWILIAGPIPGTANPHTYTWTVPVLNDTSVFVNVSAMDPLGNVGFAVVGIPEIDSAQPSVVGRAPPNGSSGIALSANLIVTFDEAMDRAATATPATAALQDLSTLAWIPVSYSWSGADTVLTMDPVPILTPATMYRGSINVSARDASDPGNPLSAASAWTFTTVPPGDLEPPQISNVVRTPAVAEYPAPVDVTATITDNVAVAAAYVSVIRPDASRLNLSMSFVSGNTWSRSPAYSTVPPNFTAMIGNYLFVVEAEDSSGNWNRSAQGTFTVRDTTRPAISNLAATPSPAEVYAAVNVTVTVSDPFLASVDVVVNGTNASMTPGAVLGTWYRLFTPMAVQAYAIGVWAGDAGGNFGSASGTVTAQDTTDPPMPIGLSATVVGGAIQVSWTGVSSPDLDGYKLYRSTASSGPFTTQVGPTTISGTAHTDQSVQPGVTYYYVVSAVDTRGRESMQSNIASATVPSTSGVDFTLWIIAGVAIAIILAVLVVAFLLLRRRRAQPPKT